MSYLGQDIPKLGFGLMRLPMLDKEIDIEQTKTMVDKFLAAGFTYFDTAYGYHEGKSEEAAKIALVDRHPREKFQLATKLPAWFGPKNAEEARQMFFTSLERTGAGYFDFYLLHNCGAERTKVFDDFGLWDFVLEQREKGLIKHVGFSMHDTADVLDDILTKHPEMEFVQLQVNYADWDSPTVQSAACLAAAKKHGKPVVIMEPVKGGLLSTLTPPAAAILSEADPQVSPASWALRFAASLDNVITVLSGMSNTRQMEDNLAVMADFRPLAAAEYAVIEKVKEALNAVESVPCTNCAYCLTGCPQGIAIPDIFGLLNQYLMFDSLEPAKSFYGMYTRGGGAAGTCSECAQCESVCPQGIGIIQELKRAAAIFE
ncbi:MAG: aldo/keto reductase [Gracilibacteraceae bacterium]|jgi:predicted aldo/keto reductase-like oxidoreductase|nr:aldo/keto reductase [Gracilibacteraceae bacterium]